MPIIHFINNKTQTAGGMRNVLNYVSRKEKTVSEDKCFVTGVNCSPETALDEMTATKNLYHKSDGRLYYHLVQSFPSGYEIEPELVHKIAVELAEKAFGKYEVVVATHIDREHIHSHLVSRGQRISKPRSLVLSCFLILSSLSPFAFIRFISSNCSFEKSRYSSSLDFSDFMEHMEASASY